MDINDQISTENTDSKSTINESIVYTVKYALDSLNTKEYIENLSEEIKQKDEDIKNTCNAYQNNLVDNLKEFTSVKNEISTIKDDVSQFEEKLQSLIKTNIYNASKTMALYKGKQNIIQTLEILNEIQEVTKSLEKAISYIKSGKFMPCLRIIQGIKNKPIFSQPSSIVIRKMYCEIFPLIVSKIRKIIDEMMNDWLKHVKSKQVEYSVFLVNQISEKTARKMAKNSIVTNTGNRGSIMYGGERQSIYGGRSSIGMGMSLMGGLPYNNRASIMMDTRTISLGIDIKGFQNTKMIEEYLKKDIKYELKIDFYTTNQCREIYENLNESGLFYECLKIHRKQQLIQTCEPEAKLKLNEFKLYMGQIIGFFVVQKEIENFYKNLKEIDHLWLEASKILLKEIEKLFSMLERTEDFSTLKMELQLFILALIKSGFSTQATMINDCIKSNYLKFSEKMIKNTIDFIKDKIQNENFNIIMVRTPTDLREYMTKFEIDKILGYDIGPDINKDFQPMELNYTMLVPNIGNAIIQVILTIIQISFFGVVYQ